jgi:hypothetical protein
LNLPSDKLKTWSQSSANSRRNKQSHIQLGNGDPNTKYTAFRELFEETSYPLENNDQGDKNGVDCMFDLNVVYNKLYNTNSYLYLGGDKLYSYDMYSVFFDVSELTPTMRNGFLKWHTSHIENKSPAHTKQEPDVMIENNREMTGIGFFLLDEVCVETRRIDYSAYSTKCVNDTKHNCGIKQNKNYHDQNYGSPILDMMRPCFADALVKYSNEFEEISTSFSDIKGLMKLK